MEPQFESKNKPYVKKFTGTLGQDGWKAMNKHGKTKYFNNEDSAKKHAGLNEGITNTTIHKSDTHEIIHHNQNYHGKDHVVYLVKTKDKSHWGFSTSNHRSLSAAAKKAGIKVSDIDHPLIKEDLNEILGKENDIGTPTLTKKYKRMTPGQEKAEINELSNDTLKSYAKNAAGSAARLQGAADHVKALKNVVKHNPEHQDLVKSFDDSEKKHRMKSFKRLRGVSKAVDKLSEGLWIVAGQHQEQGHIRSKTYKASSKDHAIKQFHDDHGEDNYSISKVKQLDKLKGESIENQIENDLTETTRSPTITVRENGKEKSVRHTDYHKDLQKLMAGHIGIAAFKKKYGK